MAGTKEGGRKAAAKNLQRDPSFYAKIGKKGGMNGHTGGFAANPDLARVAGKKGGQISRRRKAVSTQDAA
jgi:general stress protein YciG